MVLRQLQIPLPWSKLVSRVLMHCQYANTSYRSNSRRAHPGSGRTTTTSLTRLRCWQGGSSSAYARILVYWRQTRLDMGTKSSRCSGCREGPCNLAEIVRQILAKAKFVEPWKPGAPPNPEHHCRLKYRTRLLVKSKGSATGPTTCSMLGAGCSWLVVEGI